MISQKKIAVCLFAIFVARVGESQNTTARESAFAFFTQGANKQLIYQRSEENELVDLYEFREKGEYANLECQVELQNGALISKPSPDAREEASLKISPWPSKSSIQVTLDDPTIHGAGEYQPADQKTMTKIAGERFADADRQLNATYQQVIAKLEPSYVDTLRTFQREWVKNRDEAAHTLVHLNYGDLDPLDEQIEFDLTRSMATLDQVKLLNNYPDTIVAPGVTGTYRTNWQRTLSIDESKGEVIFEITAFNPRNGSTGDLVGKAKLDGNKVHWVDTTDGQPDPETGQLAEVTITFKPNGIATVETKNDEAYHGVGVTFGDNYLRVSADQPKIDTSE